MAEETTALLAQALARVPMDVADASTTHYLVPEVVSAAFTNNNPDSRHQIHRDRLDSIMGAYLHRNSEESRNVYYWSHRSVIDSYVAGLVSELDATGDAPTDQARANLLAITSASTGSGRTANSVARLLLACASPNEATPDWLIEAALNLTSRHQCNFTKVYHDNGGPKDLLLLLASAVHDTSLTQVVDITHDIAEHTSDLDLLDYCLTHPNDRIGRTALTNPHVTSGALLRFVTHVPTEGGSMRLHSALAHPKSTAECHEAAIPLVFNAELQSGDTRGTQRLCSGPAIDKVIDAATREPISVRVTFTDALLCSSADNSIKEQWLRDHPDAADELAHHANHINRRISAGRAIGLNPASSVELLTYVAQFITTTVTSKYDREWDAWSAIIDHPLTPLDALRPFSKGPSLPSVAIRKRIKATGMTATTPTASAAGGAGLASVPAAPSRRQKALLNVHDTHAAVTYLDKFGGTTVEEYVTALAEIITSPAALHVRREAATILTDALNFNPELAPHADPDKSGAAFKAMGRFRDPLHFSAATLTHLSLMLDHPVIVDFAGKQLGKALLRAS